MNGIIGISFQEIPGGLKVHVKKGQNKSSPGKLKKRLPYNFKQMSKQIMMAKNIGCCQTSGDSNSSKTLLVIQKVTK